MNPPLSTTPAPTTPRRIRWFSWTLGATAVATFLPLPASLAAIAIGPVAIGFGIASMALLKGSRTSRWVYTIAGTLAAGWMALSAVGTAIIYDASIAYRDCSRDAITVTAQLECDADYKAAVAARLNEIQPGLGDAVEGSPRPASSPATTPTA